MSTEVLGPMFQNLQPQAEERKGAAFVPKATKVVQDNCGCSHEQVTRKPMRNGN